VDEDMETGELSFAGGTVRCTATLENTATTMIQQFYSYMYTQKNENICLSFFLKPYPPNPEVTETEKRSERRFYCCRLCCCPYQAGDSADVVLHV
jgi:hypothetical protein